MFVLLSLKYLRRETLFRLLSLFRCCWRRAFNNGRVAKYDFYFSTEGKAAFNCILGVYKQCPELTGRVLYGRGLELMTVQMQGGIDVYCDLVDGEHGSIYLIRHPDPRHEFTEKNSV